MAVMNRVFSVLLWAVAAIALVLGTLGIISTSETIRFVTISDDSAYPVALNGSLLLAVRVASADVVKGDTLLVGAHATQGSALGDVVNINVAKNGNRSVTLKAPNRSTPDQWDYELGATTYKSLISIPLIGKIFSAVGNHMNVWLSGALLSLMSIAILTLIRFIFFAKWDPNSELLTKKLDNHANDSVDHLINYFTDQGLTAPALYEKKKRGFRR